MVIDTHTHAAQGWNEADVREHFQATGVAKVLLSAAPMDFWGSDLNEGCARLIELFPDKAVGLIGIHPPQIDQSLRDIDQYHRKGFIGVKLMPTTGYYPDDERYRKVFEEVNARRMIVLSHCGWCAPGLNRPDLPQCTLYSHPYHLEPLIRIFPETDFIMAHGGGRTTFQEAFELVQYHENAWLDTCPGHGTWILQNAGAWLNVLNWSRVLFGTDTCYGRRGSFANFKKVEEFVRLCLPYAGFPQHVEAVMGVNGARLLKKHGVLLP